MTAGEQTAGASAPLSRQQLSPHHQRWLEMNPTADGLPAWLRTTAGELRLPLVLTVGVAIVLQFTIPPEFALKPKWAVAVVEVVLLAVLVAANPVRMRREHPALRVLSLVLTGI